MARFRTSKGLMGRGPIKPKLSPTMPAPTQSLPSQVMASQMQAAAPVQQAAPAQQAMPVQQVAPVQQAMPAIQAQPAITSMPVMPSQPRQAQSIMSAKPQMMQPQQVVPSMPVPVQNPMTAPQPSYIPNAPQTGLIGSEQALQAGLQSSLAGLQQGMEQARAGYSAGRSGGLNQLSQARGQGLQAINEAIGQGVGGLQQFTGAGLQGQQLQAALAGLQGQEAFNNALIDSPATRFLREQGEQAALRTAAARGGLGGGNVMKELSRFNTGLAAQDLQNQFDRAGALTGQGLQAAGGIGQLRSQQAGLSSGLIGDLGRSGANIESQYGQQLGGLGMQGGLFAAQSALGTGRIWLTSRAREFLT